MRQLMVLALILSAFVDSVSVATPRNSFERCFAEKINFERESRGIPILKDNERMDEISSTHSDEMAARETIYHNEDLPDEEGVRPFAAVGENVGMGSDCATLHAAFMDSPGHKANVLDRDYSELGIGVTKRDDTIYVTEVFYDPANRPPSNKSEPTSSPRPRKPKPKVTDSTPTSTLPASPVTPTPSDSPSPLLTRPLQPTPPESGFPYLWLIPPFLLAGMFLWWKLRR